MLSTKDMPSMLSPAALEGAVSSDAYQQKYVG